MERAHGKWFRLAVLPRQLPRRHDVQRNVDDVKRPPGLRRALRPLSGSGRRRPQVMHGQVVVLVEEGEGIGPAIRIGGPQEGPDEPIAVEGMEREAIDVDSRRRDAPDGQDHRQGYHEREASWPWRVVDQLHGRTERRDRDEGLAEENPIDEGRQRDDEGRREDGRRHRQHHVGGDSPGALSRASRG